MTLTRHEFEVLNVVALKKMATPATIELVIDASPDHVNAVLGELEAAGLIGRAGDHVLPVDETDAALATYAQTTYEELRRSPDVDDLHHRFDRVNEQFLAAISSWQRRNVGGAMVANDHSDPTYDSRVIDRIEHLVDRFCAIATELAAHDPRFDSYRGRMTAALDRVDGGELEFVSSPLVESIHNIWFEFHEDLLRTLGRPRKE
jgi:hypothetical protein